MSQKKPILDGFLEELRRLFLQLASEGRQLTGEGSDWLQDTIIPLLRIVRDCDLGDSKASVVEELRLLLKENLDIKWSAAGTHLFYVLAKLEDEDGPSSPDCI